MCSACRCCCRKQRGRTKKPNRGTPNVAFASNQRVLACHSIIGKRREKDATDSPNRERVARRSSSGNAFFVRLGESHV
jgi:hypothetical protein